MTGWVHDDLAAAEDDRRFRQSEYGLTLHQKAVAALVALHPDKRQEALDEANKTTWRGQV